jgi:threonyl-tRNA synthetase
MSKATDNEKNTPLYRLRHSLAHIMAQAVLEIRPGAKMAFGPPVEFGFYYDFDFGDQPLGERDLQDIENRMRRIIKEKQPFVQSYKTLDEARALLHHTNQNYKIEYVEELVATGKAGSEGLGFYANGLFEVIP